MITSSVEERLDVSITCESKRGDQNEFVSSSSDPSPSLDAIGGEASVVGFSD